MNAHEDEPLVAGLDIGGGVYARTRDGRIVSQAADAVTDDS